MYLNVHSYFSLRYGTLSPEKLVETAAALRIEAMALTDINNSAGMVDFMRLCAENGIKPIAGIEFRNGNRHLYTGIAKNNEGFRELNAFVTHCNLNALDYPAEAPRFEHAFVVYPFGKGMPVQLHENEFIGIMPRDIPRLTGMRNGHSISRMVVRQPVTFIDREGYELHRNLRAIDNNILLSRLTEDHLAMASDVFVPPARLAESFRDYPRIIRNTEKLTEECGIVFEWKTSKNKKTFTGSTEDDRILLRKLAFDGLGYRYGKENAVARQRVEKELDIICSLGFQAYFLITWDVIRYSMSRGFYHVGRGSGANSIVAYCLRITDVDPIDLNLYFERFINPRRSSPPDFDIDYSWREREEVQDYIFKRYGSQHTALLGATSTFGKKSALRELGKVYGLPAEEIDELVDNTDASLRNSSLARTIYDLSLRLLDFPNIRSVHAGGILVSEKPITCYTALDLPPKGFPTTQWDMYVAEFLGFEKLDILSQRGIGHIGDAAGIVLENRGIRVDVHQMEKLKNDGKVKCQLRKGETIGCFYIESPAMRGLLKKLRCDNYLSLVAASSIVRPGVARSGMMREYIRRFHNPGKFGYLHPVMEEQLKETFGVMVFQEDVLKVCHHFAGLDLADADVLRRAMSGKFKGKKELARITGKFFANCREKGYPEALTKEVWRQIESFAGYSFSKAHSASYAVESFQSLFLKAYFPLEFITAVINNFGGFYPTWVYFNEALRQGGIVRLPCVNESRYHTRITGKEIYVGFAHVTGLEYKLACRIVEERGCNGVFGGLEDFSERVRPGLEQLIILVRTGAFGFTGKTKAALLWEAHMALNKGKPVNVPALFSGRARQFSLPPLEEHPLETAYDEVELLGFPVTMGWFDMLQTSFRGEITAQEMIRHTGRKVRMAGNLVTIKYVRTVKKEMMHFGTFLDAAGEFFDTVHFPSSLKNYPFKGKGIYLLFGMITEEFGFASLTVEKMARLPLRPRPGTE